MIRRFTFAIALSALVVAGMAAFFDPPGAGSAGDDPPARLKKKNRAPLPVPDKDDLDKKPIPEDQPPIDDPGRKEKLQGNDDPEQPEAEGEDPSAVLERIGKNMRLSGDRLDRKELGDGLSAVQGDILKDMDALLRQQQQQQSAGGGGANQQGEPKGSASQGSGGSRQERKQQVARGMRNQPRQQKGSGQGSGQLAKSDGKPAGSGQPGSRPTQPGQESNKGGDTNPLTDIYKDPWGHLPESQRAEMDAYARDKFMAKYQDLIRQYYTTLSEKSRARGSDDR